MRESRVVASPAGRGLPTTRLHARRIVGGHRHYRHFDRPVASGGASGPRIGCAALQCANNLKQIGLAVLNFESAQRNCPPAVKAVVRARASMRSREGAVPPVPRSLPKVRWFISCPIRKGRTFTTRST